MILIFLTFNHACSLQRALSFGIILLDSLVLVLDIEIKLLASCMFIVVQIFGEIIL